MMPPKVPFAVLFALGGRRDALGSGFRRSRPLLLRQGAGERHEAQAKRGDLLHQQRDSRRQVGPVVHDEERAALPGGLPS